MNSSPPCANVMTRCTACGSCAQPSRETMSGCETAASVESSDLACVNCPVRRISDLSSVLTAHGVPVGRCMAKETRPNVPAPMHRPHASWSIMDASSVVDVVVDRLRECGRVSRPIVVLVGVVARCRAAAGRRGRRGRGRTRRRWRRSSACCRLRGNRAVDTEGEACPVTRLTDAASRSSSVLFFFWARAVGGSHLAPAGGLIVASVGAP